MEPVTIISIVLISVIVLFSGITWKIIFRLGRGIKSLFFNSTAGANKKQLIKEIEKSILELRDLKKGATIIIDQQNQTSPFIVDSTKLDANVSADLITSIFMTDTPLHDGALIVRGGKITDAAAFITSLSESKSAPKTFGTRHRSALGISEQTNSIVLVLSEETKKVTVFRRGSFQTIPLKDIFQTLSNHWTR